ncbi:hypothetical protein AaE_013335 [Aphanomyces astaci]|uniref:Uncharacterized protein n=1 Tax=Aphanomyces astaci TaxID=112090 RepID=A0A6A4Z7Q3_APHAT|nr:hypothetical protein AaE_013335 [Aphanomyces astaci]
MGATKRKHAERQVPAEPGDGIKALRVVDNTRKQYESTLARWARWLEKEHPSSIDQGGIVLPLTVPVCKGLLTYSSSKRNRQGVELMPQQYNSYATISGVISAIKYLYTERAQSMHGELETMFTENCAGYKRKVVQLRSSGKSRANLRCPSPDIDTWRFEHYSRLKI